MSDPRREATSRLLVLRVLKDQITRTDIAERQAAAEHFDVPGVRDIGVIGDEQIGSVQLTKGRVAPRVTDEAALLAWCKANRPEEVETVERVRPAYVAAVLDMARKSKDYAVTADGELIPGVQATEGEPTLTVKPSEDAAEKIRAALASGALTLGQVLGAIEARS